MTEIDRLFASTGKLASALKGFNVRASQRDLANKISTIIADKSVLLAEAGTGTGKTFSYLLPAFLSHRKTLISTATKNLQEQIFEQDIPFVKKILGSTAKIALLKGRNNYFCPFYFEQLLQTDAESNLEKKYRHIITEFSEATIDGDLVNLKGIPQDELILSKITSTADNCLGQNCEFFEECFVQKARKKAKEADMIVVNHHLLLADFALRSEGFTEILPDIESFIIDEAHHLPPIASNFLGQRLSHRQVKLLVDDLIEGSQSDAADALELQRIGKIIEKDNDAILKSLESNQKEYIDDPELSELSEFWGLVGTLNDNFFVLKKELDKHKSRGDILGRVAQRLNDSIEILSVFLKNIHDSESDDATDKEDKKLAKWLDIHKKNYVLNAVPINVGKQLSHWVTKSDASWVFLSATLTVDGSFDHFRREIGLHDAETLQLDSPFEYRKQSVIYHPKGLPLPNHPQYTQQLITAVLPVIERSKGRAFLLFTSYRAMREAKIALQGMDFKLLVQGEGPKTHLLADFKKYDRALLLATASFWEGVDVRGDQLVCVIIDKLPFSIPDDPLTKARHQYLIGKNLSPFIHDTLPKAVISLKQGVGRLIRGSEDYGVLVIGDPRLTQKSYGKVFLKSLPRMTRTTDINIVNRLFDYYESNRK